MDDDIAEEPRPFGIGVLMSGRRLSDAEKKIWHRVARTVNPLAQVQSQAKSEKAKSSEVTPAQSKPAQDKPGHAAVFRPQLSQSQTQAFYMRRHANHAPSPVLHKTNGQLQPRSDKSVRKGKVDINTKVDLHDLTRDQAYPKLLHRIERAYGRGERTLLVVTGKGANLEGVLRKSLIGWLSTPAIRPMVAGYAQAHIRHGGMGAFYVFLKSKRR